MDYRGVSLNVPLRRLFLLTSTLIAYEGNFDALRRYFFRPRMLRDMSDGSTETSFMGFKSDLPIYIAPAAMAKLGHLLGEVNLTKAAAQYGIIQTVS